jgi:putative ABC transport system permease protein
MRGERRSRPLSDVDLIAEFDTGREYSLLDRVRLENRLADMLGVKVDLAPAIRTMDEVVVRSTARQDFNILLLTIFGCSALVLAAIGIYGLMAYSVELRTQEIGIRMALGAEAGNVRNMIVLQGMRLVWIGAAIGLAAAFGLTSLIAGFLFGVKAWDPLAFTTVPIVLAAVALFAVWLPARRATRIDPLNALRYE